MRFEQGWGRFGRWVIASMLVVLLWNEQQRPAGVDLLPPPLLQPPSCGWEGGPLPVPVYPGSIVLAQQTDEGCFFLAQASPDAIQAFYAEQMPQVGWMVGVRERPQPGRWEWPPASRSIPGYIAWMNLHIDASHAGMTRYHLISDGWTVSIAP